MIQVNFELKNDLQRSSFTSNYRHICLSGGYGNGKTTAAAIKGITTAVKFSGSRGVIGRFTGSDLQKTTMVTFYKVCPPALYDEANGGKRVDSRGYLRLINGSEIYFMHFDDYDEGTVRGLEINWCFLDQAEEISENVYLHLDSRIGRWDKATVPQDMIAKHPDWPMHPATNKPIVPGWMMIGCNPDNIYHWIYKRFHPDSGEFQKIYNSNHIMFQAGSDPSLLDPEVYKEMMSRDPVWVARFVRGEWGISEGTIHHVPDESIIEIRTEEDQKWFERWLAKAAIYRILDHGDSSPTCVLWCAVYKGFHLFYREYYLSSALISEHRKHIEQLSRGEFYVGNYADPSIFHKNSQKQGGRWSVADEYLDTGYTDAAPIYWQPADNNEFATRHRINELLKHDSTLVHPYTNQNGSSRILFIRRNSRVPDGCYEAIEQTKAQKRNAVGNENGRPVYSDDRDETIPDHAYDCVRYEVSVHTMGSKDPVRKPPAGSFLAIRKRAQEFQRQMKAFVN